MEDVDLDHFIESYFHQEHRDTLIRTPTQMKTVRAVADQRWSLAHADAKRQEASDREDAEDSSLPPYPYTVYLLLLPVFF